MDPRKLCNLASGLVESALYLAYVPKYTIKRLQLNAKHIVGQL